jgi:hypothetical protein
MWKKGYTAAVPVCRDGYYVDITPPADLRDDPGTLVQRMRECEKVAAEKAELPKAARVATVLLGGPMVLQGLEGNRAIQPFGECMGPGFIAKPWEPAAKAQTTAPIR